jgi:hypothetical protein
VLLGQNPGELVLLVVGQLEHLRELAGMTIENWSLRRRHSGRRRWG